MADQSIRVTNLADTSNGSPARVGYELMKELRILLPKKDGIERIKQIVRLYAACRDAANGSSYDLSGLD